MDSFEAKPWHSKAGSTAEVRAVRARPGNVTASAFLSRRSFIGPKDGNLIPSPGKPCSGGRRRHRKQRACWECLWSPVKMSSGTGLKKRASFAASVLVCSSEASCGLLGSEQQQLSFAHSWDPALARGGCVFAEFKASGP